jgi:hypothetical protein
MSFSEAIAFFHEALMHVNASSDPATWNMLNGLIKLSESLTRLQSAVQTLDTNLDRTSADVKRIKHR